MKSLQRKMVTQLILTSALPLVAVGIITVAFISRMAVHEARQRIINNLQIARSIYESAQDHLKYVTRDQNRRLATLIMEDQVPLLRNEYAKVIREHKFDFFIITDAGGTVIISMTNPGLEGYNFSRDLLIRRAMRGQVNVCAEVMAEYELAKFGLLEKAKIPGVTPTDALLIRTSQPLINTNEIIIGTVTAGYLLNNNTDFIIDKITSGTDFVATLFLGPSRVASNVPAAPGMQVLGTRLPDTIAQPVLQENRMHIGKLIVSEQWYLAGYAPILDIKDNPIGVLGIGIPQKNVFGLRDRLVLLFVLAVILSIVLSMTIGLVRGGHIVRSIRKLRTGIAAFGSGDLDYRIIDINSGDEIEDLADFFNQTMLQLQLTKKELEQSSRRVAHLTDEVSRSSQQLDEAHKQLLEYERMAAMGRMATVINHELRNIFAEIQASVSSLKAIVDKDMPPAGSSVRDIEKGLAYANEVLNNVLRISYPKRLMFIDVDVHGLIEDLAKNPNIRSLAQENRVKIATKITPRLPVVQADGLQLREVLSILITNAIQAMDSGGTVTVEAGLDKTKMVIDVIDTGPGIPADVKENLFTPFFTTKHRGLGLGLCISREIIKAHRGTLEVFTEVGKGTTFSIRLPLKNGGV
ncbi:MAG: cache domain-containing protein [Candidatus Omnitrophica bacterium]|nr:cache domain-containing protein [Candidatus Omnitrophota bacterium]